MCRGEAVYQVPRPRAAAVRACISASRATWRTALAALRLHRRRMRIVLPAAAGAVVVVATATVGAVAAARSLRGRPALLRVADARQQLGALFRRRVGRAAGGLAPGPGRRARVARWPRHYAVTLVVACIVTVVRHIVEFWGAPGDGRQLVRRGNRGAHGPVIRSGRWRRRCARTFYASVGGRHAASVRTIIRRRQPLSARSRR